MNLITGQNISLSYPKATQRTLSDVNFEIPKGRITLFMGRSGSGKTSLLRCISNLITDYSGDILFENKPIKSLSNAERAKSVGFVAQQFNLFPHMTVLQNCVQPQRIVLGRSEEEASAKAHLLLSSLGIEQLASRKPHQLSGGQMQRVAIARALCMDAKALLLDEPTSALDPESTGKLREILNILLKNDVSVAISTHDMGFARSVYDRGYFLEGGRILEESADRIHQYMQS
ncbi:MAG: ATP-binding cassette domain-containing protein [Myxococcota bacterium]